MLSGFFFCQYLSRMPMIAEKAINQRGWRFLVNLTALVRTRSAAARMCDLRYDSSGCCYEPQRTGPYTVKGRIHISVAPKRVQGFGNDQDYYNGWGYKTYRCTDRARDSRGFKAYIGRHIYTHRPRSRFGDSHHICKLFV